LLAYCLMLPARRGSFAYPIAAIVIVVGIGFSRFYLRAHWFSDVVAGWAAGTAWLFFCLGWLERKREVPREDASSPRGDRGPRPAAG
jgi:undecaprenyl-diphosphatase